jgi:S1-C subfamily serine protease
MRPLAVVASLAVVCLCGVIGLGVTDGTGAIPGPPKLHWPKVPPLPNSVRSIIAAEPVKLAADAETQRIEKLTLRIRNISCGSASDGSGFAADAHTLITNRHVIVGAGVLQADTWDGVTTSLDVSRATTAKLVDIGVVTVAQPLPVIAQPGPPPKNGAAVTAVGYPLGGALTITHGHFLSYVDGENLPSEISFPGQVLAVSAPIKHGNSGGPLLDSRGRLIGVVYAGLQSGGERSQTFVTYAIPLSAVDSLIALGGNQPVQPCGL